MALDDPTLKTDLRDLLDGTIAYPATAALAGPNWATVYGDYALTGTANAVSPVEVAGARATMGTSIGAGFAAGGGGAAVAAAITAALDAYWTAGITFAGAISPPVPTGSVALTAALTLIFSVIGGTHDSKATEVRDAMAAYTKLVKVTFPGPADFFVV